MVTTTMSLDLKNTLRARAQRVADKTQDAYSRDRYSAASWRACCALLLRRGFTEREAEMAMRSRWLRAAADFACKVADATSRDLARYLDDNRYGVEAFR